MREPRWVEPAVSRLAGRLKALRRERDLTLDELAERSDVSRSALSKIERGEINPTIVLVSKIADAFGISVSQLIGVEGHRAAVHVPRDRRVSFVDPETGFERQIFPAFEDAAVEFGRHVIPPGKSSGDFPGHDDPIEKYILMEKGRLNVVVGETTYELEEGDLLFFDGSAPHRFDNAGRGSCSYYLIKRRP
jgi:transcriptional regulator with XRE-family HTH domain